VKPTPSQSPTLPLSHSRTIYFAGPYNWKFKEPTARGRHVRSLP
jgi:hypothetical protein